MSQTKVSTLNALKTGGIAAVFGLIIYAMVYVAFDQLLADTIMNAVDTENITVTVIFLGFILASVMGIIAGSVAGEQIPSQVTTWASILAMLVNIIVWVSVAFLVVIDRYPTIIPVPSPDLNFFVAIAVRGFLYLFSIPQVLGVFAVFCIGNTIAFWVYALMTQTVWFTVFLITLGRK